MNADETVGVALAGFGYWGRNLARNIASTESLRLVGVVDADEGQRKAAASTYPEAATWADLDQALASPDVEAVVLAVPALMHAAMATQVLDAGRHVLVEKPLATTVDDAEAVADLADANGLVAMVGHTFLYSPPVQRLRALIAEGELGDLQYLYSQRLSLGRIRRDCNALWNFAPHDISIMVHLLEEQPCEVSAKGFSFIGEGVEDVFFVSMEFPSGIGANLHVSWIDPRKTRLMTVVGDEKMAIYNDVSVDQKLWLVDAGVARNEEFGAYESMGDFQWRTRAGDILIPRIEMSEPLANEMAAFGAACRGGGAPVTDARHGVDVVRVLAAIDRSAAEGGSPVAVGS